MSRAKNSLLKSNITYEHISLPQNQAFFKYQNQSRDCIAMT